uniref:Ribonuclease H protein At1g65750 family n=1 Tax=Cajanus cajan TaxID=3821 RepID=A0A151QUH8_CAJCA|nr:Putative ribonuclease H protein At1g65750 family [Cajanus cajan]
MTLPFVYLGIPIGANPRRQQMWKEIMLKYNRKLALWRSKNLSLAARVCLINSVLSGLPLYLISLFKMPKQVVRQLEKIQRNFLWGSKDETRKISWVKWRTIFHPKEKGGLGIKNIESFNDALLGKWKWQLFHQEDSMWGRLLLSKYGGWQSLLKEAGHQNSSIW